jgi:ribose 5-phosphate isomerase B
VRIAIGSDHAGLTLKATIRAHLAAAGHQLEDVGTHDTASCDYPDFAHAVARLVAGGGADRGVLVCGSGIGMAIAANKVPGARAAVVSDPLSARLAAEHNDARILCVGERIVGPGLALACVDAWLGAAFEGGRHARRVARIEVP